MYIVYYEKKNYIFTYFMYMTVTKIFEIIKLKHMYKNVY